MNPDPWYRPHGKAAKTEGKSDTSNFIKGGANHKGALKNIRTNDIAPKTAILTYVEVDLVIKIISQFRCKILNPLIVSGGIQIIWYYYRHLLPSRLLLSALEFHQFNRVCRLAGFTAGEDFHLAPKIQSIMILGMPSIPCQASSN